MSIGPTKAETAITSRTNQGASFHSWRRASNLLFCFRPTPPSLTQLRNNPVSQSMGGLSADAERSASQPESLG